MVSDRERERRLSERMGVEERSRVERAAAAALQYQPQRAADLVTAAAQGRAEERERCLACCLRFPDNLMAREIARLIREGKETGCC